jgi:hypothetical protein
METIRAREVACADRACGRCWRRWRRDRFARGRLERASIAACFETAATALAVRVSEEVGPVGAGAGAEGGARLAVSRFGAWLAVFRFGADDSTGAGSGATTPPEARSGPGALVPPVVDPLAPAGAVVATHASSATIAAQLVRMFSVRSGRGEVAPARRAVADRRASAGESHALPPPRFASSSSMPRARDRGR